MREANNASPGFVAALSSRAESRISTNALELSHGPCGTEWLTAKSFNTPNNCLHPAAFFTAIQRSCHGSSQAFSRRRTWKRRNRFAASLLLPLSSHETKSGNWCVGLSPPPGWVKNRLTPPSTVHDKALSNLVMCLWAAKRFVIGTRSCFWSEAPTLRFKKRLAWACHVCVCSGVKAVPGSSSRKLEERMTLKQNNKL